MDNEKYVDESWKNEVSRDKGCGCGSGCGCSGHEHEAQASEVSEGSCGSGCGCGSRKEPEGELEVNFLNYVMSMGYQAMIFLGEVPNPVTGQQEVNPRQAKFLIDTLNLIKEKTRGNLSGDEEGFLSSTVYELQMKYVQIASKGSLPEGL